MKHTDNSPQLETPASAPVAVLTNRAAYLASNPDARRVHEEHMAEFRAKFSDLQVGKIKEVIDAIRQNPDMTEVEVLEILPANLPASVAVKTIIVSTEKSRQAGISLMNWCETLPGRRLTIDLYEQHKHELVDSRGISLTYPEIMWFIGLAKTNKDKPIETLYEAIKYRQGLLIANSEGESWEDVRPPQKAVPPPDPLVDIKKIMNPAAIGDAWKRLQANPNYFRGGHLREDLRDTLIEDFKPVFELVDKIKAEFAV